MKIALVYALDNYGCAPTYTLKAFERLGFDVKKMNPEEYFRTDPDQYDLFFCQDSGEGIDFTRAGEKHLHKTSMWYWDSRFNRIQRTPGDDLMAQHLVDNGGWVFQAQTPDYSRLRSIISRMSYLPIAADPYIWNNGPKENKLYKCSFVGNCYDAGRGAALNYAKENCSLYWPGPNSVFFEDAAKIYRQSHVVFHAPTFYNLPHDVTHQRVDYDVTMRYYESAACGIPVVTPPMPDFERLEFRDGFQIFIYNSLEEIPGQIDRAIEAAKDETYSDDLRSWILGHHTYEIRLKRALTVLSEMGMVKL